MKKKINFLDDAFEAGLLLKGINGFFEILGGISFLFITPARLQGFILRITEQELIKDPKDHVANYLLHFSEKFTKSSEIFASLFLFSHGIIKLFLIYNLLKKKVWAYPLSIVVFGLFVIYQTYRFTITHSPGLIILDIFDLGIIVLTALEYRKLENLQK